jgi:hypothetical protein
MKSKPIVPRTDANRDVDEAIEPYLTPLTVNTRVPLSSAKSLGILHERGQFRHCVLMGRASCENAFKLLQ